MRHPIHLEHLGSLDAFTCARALSQLPDLLFLDSALRHPVLGRYSFVAADPFGRFAVRGGRALWNGDPLAQPPLSALRSLLDRYRQSRMESLPPFQGGAAGYLAYDFRHTLERLTPAPTDVPCPEAVLPFYDVVVSFDHRSGDAWLVSTGWPEQDPDKRQKRAAARAQQFRRLLGHGPRQLRDCRLASPWTSNFSASGYRKAVKAVIDSILAGDIFQANIAQRFTACVSDDFDALAFYGQLRRVNPATFGAFLSFDESTIASSSPERFLKVDQGCVETRPIKGTVARSSDQQRDGNLAETLLRSDKDRAENLMIVDLLRNDLSRVCKPHTVRTPVLCNLESYAAVHHLVSVVEGQLQPGVRAWQATTCPNGQLVRCWNKDHPF